MAQKRVVSTKHLWALSRQVFLSIVLVGLLVTFIPFSAVRADLPSDHVVNFADPNLEAAIRDAIGKPTGDILQSDLDTLLTLDASTRGITNLTGIEHCTSLIILSLHTNQIGNISPLAGLTSLTELVLRNNQISNVSPLASLANLTHLRLDNNQISDISPLAGLTNLTDLRVYGNQISNISPLAGLNNLAELFLADNQIGDISSLSSLTSLTDLDLGDNLISDTSPLAGLTNLTSLSLYNNQISNILATENLTDLTELLVGNNQISDISPLAGLTNLTILYLYNNQISNILATENLTDLTELLIADNQIGDLLPLSSLTSLTGLDLSNNQVGDISPLAGLTSLTSLYLSNNDISNVLATENLTNLTELRLGANQISNISPLAGLTDLTVLHLYNNNVSNILATENLTNLTELLLGINQISDISPLAGLTILTTLNLHANLISDISPLAGLTSLTNLYLAENDISDIQPLVNNAGLASGDSVYLNTNPDLTNTSKYVHIPALEARGVEVYWDVPDTSPPNQPGNVSPGDGAVAVSLTPTLQSSGFSDPDAGDTHTASWWKISTTSGDYSSSVFDSYADNTSLTSITIPSSTLDYSTTYYWHVRHKDNHGAWSPWSDETSFTTVPTYPLVTTNAANNITTTSATLNGTLTSKGTATTVNVSFEWGTDTSYSGTPTTPVARDTTGTFSAPLSGLSPNTTYHFRAKAVGNGTDFGEDVTFTTSTTPPSVTTDNATSVTTTSATLNGNLDAVGTAGSVTVSFAWGTADGGPYTNPVTVSPAMSAPGAFSAPLSGLTPKTTYYYIAKAVGDGSVDGAQVSFTTSTTPPSVTTNTATPVTTTSATLNGNLDAMGTASSVTVSFVWGTADGGPYTHPVTVSPAMSAPGAFSAPLSGLTPKTTYYYIARAVGDGSVDGAQMSFTTSTIPPSVTTDNATSIATSSATLNGNLTAKGTADNITVSFEYGTTSGGSFTAVAAGWKGAIGTFSVNLSGLTPGATYYYRAVADGDGDPVYGLEKSFTASTTPPTVSTSTASSLAATSATLNGNLGSLGTATSVTVSFQWGTTASYGSETSTQSVSAIGAFSANLTGLTANSTYHFRAKAVGHGAAVYGADMTFNTPDTTAPVISLVNSTSRTKTGATITWTTNEAATSQIEYGLTEEYGSSTTLDTSLVTSHSVELAGLKAGKTYHYRVISNDAANNQAVSADATFKTAASSGGMPAWAWVIIGLAVVGAVGAAAFLIRGRLAQG